MHAIAMSPPALDLVRLSGEASPDISASNAFCTAAKSRLLAARGDPFLHVDWHSAVFFNFLIPPEVLAPIIPKPLELQTHNGMGCVSLAAVRMRNFRSCRKASPARCFSLIREQRFLNLRIYVSCGEEPGALFLFGWLSRPLALPMPSALFRLSYQLASLEYQHSGSEIAGSVSDRAGRFGYHAKVRNDCRYSPCSAGSAAEFALERYSGFFIRSRQLYVFRVWHPPWLQVPISADIEETRLITNRFPWFAEAKFCGAHLTATLNDVWMGKPHRVPIPETKQVGSRRVLSAFYEMP